MDLFLDLPQHIGGGYDDFINTKARYRVVKGSRGSKKSCTICLQYIYDIMYCGLTVHYIFIYRLRIYMYIKEELCKKNLL